MLFFKKIYFIKAEGCGIFCLEDTYFCFTKYGARKIGGTPHAFLLYRQIKRKPWGKNTWPATGSSLSARSENKMSFKYGPFAVGCHMGFAFQMFF